MSTSNSAPEKKVLVCSAYKTARAFWVLRLSLRRKEKKEHSLRSLFQLSMSTKLKVYIADDHTLFRKAMVNLLKTFPRVNEVKDAENGKELLTLIKYDVPDVAIVDLQMPVMDGSETCGQIIQKYPDVKLIILTMHDSEKYILHMMEMGVHAFLLKNTEPDELEKAIYAVAEKDFYHNELVA